MPAVLLLSFALVQGAPGATDPAAPPTRAQPMQPIQTYFRSWARDAAGNPVPDSCTQHVSWGLPEHPDPIPQPR
jgi:hypothetical protein